MPPRHDRVKLYYSILLTIDTYLPGEPNVLSARLAGRLVLLAILQEGELFSVAFFQPHISLSNLHSPALTIAPKGSAEINQGIFYLSITDSDVRGHIKLTDTFFTS